MKFKTGKLFRRTVAAILLLVGCAVQSQAETVLFEDNFDSGSMSSEWVSKAPTQWVQDGWLHTKDTDGWPRDSMAVVHDSDSSWTDYKVSFTAQFSPGTPWERFCILLRTDNYIRTSAGSTGKAYQLRVVGPNYPDSTASTIFLDHVDQDTGSTVTLFSQEWDGVSTEPMDFVVSLIGGRIRLTLDGEEVFDITDPDPLLSGGAGVHAVWEAEARFDNFKITALDKERNILLWNKLGSVDEIANSEIGPDGYLHGSGVSFVEGIDGNGFTTARGKSGPNFGSWETINPDYNLAGTIEFWWKAPRDYNEGNSSPDEIFVSGTWSNPWILPFQMLYRWREHAGLGGFELRISDSQKEHPLRTGKVVPFQEGDWVHVAFLWDMNGLSVDDNVNYGVVINGKYVPLYDVDTPGASLQFDMAKPSGAYFAMGYYSADYNNQCNGVIDEVKIWDYARSPEIDTDNDGILDATDNCPSVANPDQLNTDGDDEGDACDADDDNDTVLDSSDNCPLIVNADQANNDGDSLGDVCDDDDDNDNVPDAVDNCQFSPNSDQSDIDADGQGDVCDGDQDGDGIDNETDNCVDISNVDQSNNDGDEQGDACDVDDDNDGVADDQPDNCPMTGNADQDDLDNDNIGDACDLDLDGDGVENEDDNCAWTANIGQEDTDFDGDGDACDNDDDNDGVPDADDNCSLIYNADQSDTDSDGQGDVCDGDLDGDGAANETDNCPNTANGSQTDYDGDSLGDVCDDDVDGDDVTNDGDVCAFTELDVIVDSAGCSIDQLCPCEGPRGITSLWKNHGKYVSCTAKSAKSFVGADLITKEEKHVIISEAAHSECGHKKPKRNLHGSKGHGKKHGSSKKGSQGKSKKK